MYAAQHKPEQMEKFLPKLAPERRLDTSENMEEGDFEEWWRTPDE